MAPAFERAVDSSGVREAARLLFGLEPQTRSRPLKERRTAAAGVSGVTPESFRVRREARVCDAIARALLVELAEVRQLADVGRALTLEERVVTLERTREGRTLPVTRPASDSLQRQFLENAVLVLADLWERRLKHLPSVVGDLVYDEVWRALERRAAAGITGFLDEHGAISASNVRAYVQLVAGSKVQRAWAAAHEPGTVPIDDLRVEASGLMGDAAEAAELILARLAADEAEDAHLLDARAEIARQSLRLRESQAARTTLIEQGLSDLGVTGAARSIVAARSERELVLGFSEGEIRPRFLPPTPWREIGARLGVTEAAARQSYQRTLRKLPAELRELIQDPK
jgi:hypothetical protein